MMIQDKRSQGIYIKDIAHDLGVSERTVRRALKRGGPPMLRRKPKASKLEPYQHRVDELLSAGVWNAQVILSEIRTLGYDGG